jgi:hypothetical protein
MGFTTRRLATTQSVTPATDRLGLTSNTAKTRIGWARLGTCLAACAFLGTFLAPGSAAFPSSGSGKVSGQTTRPTKLVRFQSL